MECGGGELSDSGSSGYWSWDHGNVSPAPSPSVTEVDSSPDEGLHMELEQGDERTAKKPKVGQQVLRCVSLWAQLTPASPAPPSVPPELVQRGIQVSVAQLWEGADLVSWNKATHSRAPSGVSWNRSRSLLDFCLMTSTIDVEEVQKQHQITVCS